MLVHSFLLFLAGSATFLFTTRSPSRRCSFLKRQFDPYHILEINGYLKVAPFLGGAVYLGLIFVQRNIPQIFPSAYIAGAVVVFGPLAALYLLAS